MPKGIAEPTWPEGRIVFVCDLCRSMHAPENLDPCDCEKTAYRIGRPRVTRIYNGQGLVKERAEGE